MIKNLKIALKKQKRLIILFILTILVPSLFLSTAGIRAIKNERFRIAKQLENEHRRAADFIKAVIQSHLNKLDSLLQEWIQSPSLAKKDYTTLQNLIPSQEENNSLMEHIFIIYRDDEYFFPHYPGANKKTPRFTFLPLSPSQMDRLNLAEEHEFRLGEIKKAISLYQDLLTLTQNRDFLAQMLNNIARCHTKLNNQNLAIDYYSRISRDYPECTTSNGVPLVLIARMQIIDGYVKLGNFDNSLKNAVDFYRDILQEPWSLTGDQYKTYSSLAEEAITHISSMHLKNISVEELVKEYEGLKNKHQKKREELRVIHDIIHEIIPEMRSDFVKSTGFNPKPRYYSTTLDNRAFFVSSHFIPDESGVNAIGTLGAKINSEYLINIIAREAIQSFDSSGSSESMNIVITTISGEIIYGNKSPSTPIRSISESLEGNLPPWRIEFFHGKAESFGIAGLTTNFYFWTIATLIFILTFGIILIGRTIAHEMEILKIKSDFVSSVSHEFKTPLTSMKALIERLKEGKVKTSTKMNQYYSVISQDADKLAKLVKNILDFSKIEEGKKEYNFEKTDLAQLLAQHIEAFRQNDIQKRISIHTQIAEDIPLLHIDRDAIIQALNNLIDNAVKFSQKKGEIFVSLRKNKSQAIIEVKDKGIGIPQQEISKIFDKFYQGGNALKYSIKGTGLGLTLVKHIVEGHEGRISVNSKVGEGSTFSLYLPLKRKGK